MKLTNKCAKQTTIAIIVSKDEIFIGTNWCGKPQEKCPREGMKTGEGYELCMKICRQRYHAEVDACIKAGDKAKGASLYLIGHYYFCDRCLDIMKAHGIQKIYITKELDFS